MITASVELDVSARHGERQTFTSLCAVNRGFKGSANTPPIFLMFMEIESGELCPSCGEIPLLGDEDEEVECPNCGEIVSITI